VKILLILTSLTLASSVFPQDDINKQDPEKKIYTRINVIDEFTSSPMEGVYLTNNEGDTLLITHKDGMAVGKTPKSLKFLTATHIRYYNRTFRVKSDVTGTIRNLSISMIPIDTSYHIMWKEKRHIAQICINEFFNGSIGTRYLYEFKRDKYLGAHLSIYSGSLPPKLWSSETYDGFKLSFIYQYYLINDHFGRSVYVEPKISIGYFDSDNIHYYGGDYKKTYSTDFFTAGLGCSIGFNGLIKKTVLISFTFGFQYFPSKAPNTIVVDGKEYTLVPSDILYSMGPYWEMYGPGAIFEVKLLIGVNF